MNKYIGIIILCIGCFALGKYTTPTKVVTEVKTVTVEKLVERETKHINRNIKKIEKKDKDGTVTIETTIQEKMDSDSKKEQSLLVQEDVKKITESKSSSFNIDILSGLDINKPTNLTFGGHVSNNLIGPIRIGVFGFSNGFVGGSLGIQF